MKYVAGPPATLELTRRNLETLLAKLDDPASARKLTKQEEREDGDAFITVAAVEDEAGPIVVTAVEDAAHYTDRAPGVMYMPTRKAFH